MRWLSGLLLLSACGGCANSLVPRTMRPDTRQILGVTVDSTAVAQTFVILRAAYPNEASVCYTGIVHDTVFVGRDQVLRRALLLKLTEATVSQQDSANHFHVWYSKPGAGCDKTAIAAGHSHPSMSARCDQSDDDAILLFQTPRMLVSLAWCANGSVSVLWQDGRRSVQRWAP